MKKNHIIYFIATGLLTALMLMSSSMYFFNTTDVKGMFENFGYPSYLVIPLAIAKILGLLAIWFAPSRSLKEWAYAGFFFDLVLAFFAHIAIEDGAYSFSSAGIVFLVVSYFFGKKIGKLS